MLKFIKSELEPPPRAFIFNPYQYRENYLKSGAVSANMELETEIIFENEDEENTLINLTAIMLRQFLHPNILAYSDKQDEYFPKAVESSKKFWERLRRGTLKIKYNKSNGLAKTYEPKDNNGINGDNGLRINLSNDNIITGFNVKQPKSVATKLQELTSSIENESDRYNKIIEYFGSGDNDNGSIWYELRLNNIDTGYSNINLGQEKFQKINDFLKNKKIDPNGQISISQIFSIIFADSIVMLEGIRGLSDEEFTLQEIKESKFEIKRIFAFLFKLKSFYPKQYKEVRKRFEELSADKDFDILAKEVKEETILLKKENIPLTVDALKVVKEEVLKEKLLLELQFSDSESAEHWYPFKFAPAGYYEILLLSTLIAGVKNSVIVLDEPAQNLHPTLQHKLLLEIDKYSKDNKNQYFIITHSPDLVKIDKESIKNIFIFRQKNKATFIDKFEPDKLDQVKFFKYEELKRLFFVKGVILVEGFSEEILMNRLIRTPIFFENAKKNVLNNETSNNTVNSGDIEVVNIEGVNSLMNFICLAFRLKLPYVAIIDNDIFNTESKIFKKNEGSNAKNIIERLGLDYKDNSKNGFKEAIEKLQYDYHVCFAKPNFEGHVDEDFKDYSGFEENYLNWCKEKFGSIDSECNEHKKTNYPLYLTEKEEIFSEIVSGNKLKIYSDGLEYLIKQIND